MLKGTKMSVLNGAKENDDNFVSPVWGEVRSYKSYIAGSYTGYALHVKL